MTNKHEEIKWRDGVIVCIYAFASHTGEGGDEVFDEFESEIDRGIVLGDRVIGCDLEFSETDFVNGEWIEGVEEDGSYSVWDYCKAVLVEPEWLDEYITKAQEDARAEELEMLLLNDLSEEMEFMVKGRLQALQPTKDIHECCDGECNHDDCCGKVEANCPNYKDKK